MFFQSINIRQVAWEVLKTVASGLDFQHLPRDLANVNAWKTMFNPYKPQRGKTLLLTNAPKEDSNQPAHPLSQISHHCPHEEILPSWLSHHENMPICNLTLLKHLFYKLKQGLQGYTFFVFFFFFCLILLKHRLWVFIRTASPRRF